MLTTTIRVQVGTSVKEYAQDVAGYGDHLANGGATLSLWTATGRAKAFFKTCTDATWTALGFWVELDGSGLAYRIEFNRHGSWRILAAAPMPGLDNVKEIYNAGG